jgi:hypothetical protein
MDLKSLLSKTGKLVLNSGSCSVLDRWSHYHQPQSRNSLLLVVLSNETGEECSHICMRRPDGGPFDLGQENGQ